MKKTIKRIKNGLPVVDNQLKNYQKVIETKKELQRVCRLLIINEKKLLESDINEKTVKRTTNGLPVFDN